MTGLQKEVKKDIQTGMFPSEFSEYIYNNIMFQKIDDLEQHILDLEDKVNGNMVFIEKAKMDSSLFLESEKKKRKRKEKTVEQPADDGGDIRSIVERALEILAEWDGAEDIKIQIQYAAIIVGKIDNIKKKDIVHANDVRNKICTLLRNVIRLNASEDIFSKEQISVLKEGFALVITEKIQKEDLFQLNRKLRKKGLATMPAWE